MATSPPDPIWVDIVKILLASLFSAALSGYAVSRWKSRQDAATTTLDELCRTIELAGDLASSYWIEDDLMRAQIMAAKLQALMFKIAGLRAAIKPVVSVETSNKLANSESKFFRGISGGEFGVHNRQPSTLTSKAAFQHAVAYVVEAKKCRILDVNRFWGR